MAKVADELVGGEDHVGGVVLLSGFSVYAEVDG